MATGQATEPKWMVGGQEGRSLKLGSPSPHQKALGAET